MRGHEFNRRARALISKCFDDTRSLVENSVLESDQFFELADELMKLEEERRGVTWKTSEKGRVNDGIVR